MSSTSDWSLISSPSKKVQGAYTALQVILTTAFQEARSSSGSKGTYHAISAELSPHYPSLRIEVLTNNPSPTDTFCLDQPSSLHSGTVSWLEHRHDLLLWATSGGALEKISKMIGSKLLEENLNSKEPESEWSCTGFTFKMHSPEPNHCLLEISDENHAKRLVRQGIASLKFNHGIRVSSVVRLDSSSCYKLELALSCSNDTQHVSLENERKKKVSIQDWMAYALEKLDETTEDALGKYSASRTLSFQDLGTPLSVAAVWDCGGSWKDQNKQQSEWTSLLGAQIGLCKERWQDERGMVRSQTSDGNFNLIFSIKALTDEHVRIKAGLRASRKKPN